MDNNKDRDETPNWIFAEYLNNLPINHSFNFNFMFRNDNLMNWSYPIASEDIYCDVTNKAGFKERVQPDPTPDTCAVNKYYFNVFTTNIDDNLLDINGNLLNNVIINTLSLDNNGDPIHEWSRDDAAQKWADGKYGIVLWSSHGSRRGAVIHRNNTATLEDYYPVHTFQASCQTGWPEDPDNLATSLLRHGAVTTIAASRNAWGYSTKFENGVFQLAT